MDVSAAYSEMNDCIDRGDLDEAAEYARNIKRWLCSGGFVPAGWNAREVRAECNNVIDRAG